MLVYGDAQCVTLNLIDMSLEIRTDFVTLSVCLQYKLCLLMKISDLPINILQVMISEKTSLYQH